MFTRSFYINCEFTNSNSAFEGWENNNKFIAGTSQQLYHKKGDQWKCVFENFEMHWIYGTIGIHSYIKIEKKCSYTILYKYFILIIILIFKLVRDQCLFS